MAEDLTLPNGRFLLAKGVHLEPSHLRVMKIWGVNAASIEGISEDFPPPPADKIDPSILQAAEKLTRERFALVDLNHPLFKELLGACTLRLAQKMGQQRTGEPAWDTPVSSAQVLADPTFRPSPLSHGVNPESLVDKDICLASLPNIFFEISKVISDPRSSAIHVADVISKDTALAAKLLRMVNSAFYSFPSKIDTISRAVMIVGSKQLSTLALGTSVIKVFKAIPAGLVDMKSFWEHSITCGISARMIASFKNIPNPERLFVAGLLHDIGRIVIYKQLPRQGKEILLRAQQIHCLLRNAELEILGFDHTHIGGLLLKKWKLPLVLEQLIEFHHQPLKSQYSLEASILFVADILANALQIGTSGEHLVPPLIPPQAWEQLGLETESLFKIIQLIDRQVDEVMHNFFGGN